MSSQPPAQKRVRYQVSPSYASTTLTPYHPGPPIPIGYRSEGLLTAENSVHRWTGRVTPIDVFSDDVLLEIFNLYVDENPEAWQSLVHVCRRWRCLVFASPLRLNLRIVCTLGTPVRDMLDVWPALPLLVQGHIYETSSLDNIITALGHRNRVSGINLWDLVSSQSTKVWAAMKEPFPELMDLRLRAFDKIAPLDPDLFMGSTPRLRYLQLERIPYPGLPNLLLSATHLVSLRLYDIPHSGYISPEAMVTCLSTLTSLETLCLEFRSVQSHLDLEGQRLSLPTRSVLPALMYFHFRGVREYLENLTSRVDVPRLNNMSINFTHEIEFDNPQLARFISRTPVLKAPDEAHVIFGDSAGRVRLSSKPSGPRQFNVEISCGALEWQHTALAQVCRLSLPPLFTVEDLYICENAGSRKNWDYPMESEEWLELLKPFTSVKNLYLSDELRQRIAPVLRLLVGDRVTEVLPILESIFLEGPQLSDPYKEGIEQFTSPVHPPNFYSHSLRQWDSLSGWLGHEQNLTTPLPTPQIDWQNFSLDGAQPSRPFQEDIWQFISPQQPDPQNLHLGHIQPSATSDEDSEQHSSAQLPAVYNLYSEGSQTSRPFREGGWSDPQNVHLDWLQPSEPFHGDYGQHPSAQLPTLQNPYSVESQPSRPFQEGDWPNLQNLHVDWSLPSEPFHEDSGQHSSAQLPTFQNLYSVESQPSRPFQEGGWPGLQNHHLDWSLPSEHLHEDSQYSSAHSPTTQNLDSQPPRPLQEGRWPDPQNFHLGGSSQPSSGLFQWEEGIGQFAAARQKTTHPITISIWDGKYERVKR